MLAYKKCTVCYGGKRDLRELYPGTVGGSGKVCYQCKGSGYEKYETMAERRLRLMKRYCQGLDTMQIKEMRKLYDAWLR